MQWLFVKNKLKSLLGVNIWQEFCFKFISYLPELLWHFTLALGHIQPMAEGLGK